MADVARARLAEVLAALTGTSLLGWTESRVVLLVSQTGASYLLGQEHPWLHDDPAAAQETLVTCGLLPEAWCDTEHPRWLCSRCGGTGKGKYWSKRCPYKCGICEGLGAFDVSEGGTVDLVSVASLGVPALLRYESLARESCAALREHGCPQPERVVWRVGYRMLPGDFAWRMRGTYGVQRDGAASFPGGVFGPVRPVAALWQLGLALDAIDRDAVRIVVPPVGGVR